MERALGGSAAQREAEEVFKMSLRPGLERDSKDAKKVNVQRSGWGSQLKGPAVVVGGGAGFPPLRAVLWDRRPVGGGHAEGASPIQAFQA